MYFYASLLSLLYSILLFYYCNVNRFRLFYHINMEFMAKLSTMHG